MAKTAGYVRVINLDSGSKRNAFGAAGLAVGALVGAITSKFVTSHKDSHSTSAAPARPASSSGHSNASKIGAFDADATGIEESSSKNPKVKLVAFAERKNWRWLGRALQVQQRYGELQGNNLAASVTLQVFLSLFPLLLVASAIAGFVVSGADNDVSGRIISSMGLTGAAADAMRTALDSAANSRKAASIVGFLTLLWSALGVAGAFQYAYNQTWQVSNRGIKDKAFGFAWLAGAAVLFVASAALTTMVGWLPAGLGIVSTVAGLLVTAGLWMFTSKILPNVSTTWRELIPGTILGVIGLEVLKFAGGVWVPKAVASSSSVYGTIGVVFAVLAWLLLFGKLVVYSSVLNVVMAEANNGVTTATIQLPKTSARTEAVGNDVARSGQMAKS